MIATASSRERQQALAVFFRAHQHDLERLVASRVHNVEPEAISDACAFAWLKLVRRSDIALDRGSLPGRRSRAMTGQTRHLRPLGR